jgi:hypothetical protein
MIPIKYVRISFEKNAAIHGEAIKKVYKFVKNHPWVTIGGIGATVGGLHFVGNIAKSILPSYHILNEERKHKTMDSQSSMLQQISDSLKKPKEKNNTYKIPSIQPLS